MRTLPSASIVSGVALIGLDGAIIGATLVVIAACLVSMTRRPDRPLPTSLPAPPAHASSPLVTSPLAAASGDLDAAIRSPVHAWRRALALTLRRGAVAGPLLLIALLLAVAGQRSLAEPRLARAGFAAWIIGLLLVVLLDRVAGRTHGDVLPATADGARTAASSGLRTARPGMRAVLIGGSIISALVVWSAMRTRPVEAGHGDVAAVWMLSLALLVLAVHWPLPRPRIARLAGWLSAHRFELALGGAIALVALVLRAVALDRYPWIFSGDEGSFALSALAVLDGRLSNPFGTGWLGHPTLYFYLQAGAMQLFGETVAGVRVVSAFLGAAAVPMTYLLVRRQLGVAGAIAAAAILAAFHFHLIWSRVALNNVGDTFFIVAALYLLDVGVLGRRRTQSLLAGLTIGLAQYFYGSARLLPLIAGAYLVFALLESRPRSIVALRERAKGLAPSAGLVLVGALLAALPLLAHFSVHRAEVNARVDQVSIFASGWLERERDLTGRGSLPIIWGQFERAALLPFHTVPHGHYRTPVPFIGWPLAVPAAIGLAIVTVGLARRRYFGVAVAYWAVVIGLALTEGPPQTNRFAIAAPLLCVLAAVGLVAVARITVVLLKVPRLAAGAGMAALVVLAVGWNLATYFDDPNPIDRYSDFNTQVANRLAYELRALGPGYTVYYAAPPRMYYYGHSNIPFIAREAQGIDVETPWSSDNVPPALDGPTLFVFLPERRSELEVVQRWFPGGRVTDLWTERGDLLYTAYQVIPDGMVAPTSVSAGSRAPQATPGALRD